LVAVRDNGDDPQAQWWTDNERTKELAEREGSEVMEYVPAEQLQGAVYLPCPTCATELSRDQGNEDGVVECPTCHGLWRAGWLPVGGQ
jgi:hypothetical protein